MPRFGLSKKHFEFASAEDEESVSDCIKKPEAATNRTNHKMKLVFENPRKISRLTNHVIDPAS